MSLVATYNAQFATEKDDQVQLLKQLLEYNAMPDNTKTADSHTSVYSAASNRRDQHVQIMKQLLKYNSPRYTKTYGEETYREEKKTAYTADDVAKEKDEIKKLLQFTQKEKKDLAEQLGDLTLDDNSNE